MKPILPITLRSNRLFRKYFYSFINILLVSFLILSAAMLLITVGYWGREKLQLLEKNTYRTAQLVSSIYSAGGSDILYSDQRHMLASLLISNFEALEADFFLCNLSGEVIACRDYVSADPSVPVLCTVHGAVRFPTVTAIYAASGGFCEIGNPGGMFSERRLLAFEPYALDGHTIGFVVAAQPLHQGMLSYMSNVFRLFLVSCLIVFLVDFILVYCISYRLVRPVGEMVTATKKYAKGDFGFRVEVDEEDELGLLADSINSMAASLANLESSRRSFVANVSHELKTPMTTIGGFVDGMLDGTIPESHYPKYMGLVSDEVKRLARLVTGMLNLSRMEAGEMQLNLTPFPLNEIIFATALSFEQLITKKQIELAGLDEIGLLPYVGDRDLLTQVFYNLMDNAVKFTPAAGRIVISSERRQGELRVFIKNTGTGISAQDITRIFERFYKADPSRSCDAKSAGLGLYLAKTIVKMHGGTIGAESDGASYTQVAVRLPLDENDRR
jgi:signal transduction histidine kinase